LLADHQLDEATFEHAAIGLAHFDPMGRWLRVNPRLCEILGYAKTDLLGRRFQDISHPDDLESDLIAARKLLDGKSDRYSLEKRYIRKDGRVIWANLTVSCIRKPSGEVDYFISSVEDVTDRVQAKIALQASETRFKLFQSLSPDGFIIFSSVRDSSEKITDFLFDYINPSGEAFIGRQHSEVIGRTLLEILPGNREEGLFDAYCRVVETGETWTGEFPYFHEGIDRWFRVTATKTGDGFAVSFADVSETKQSEARLQSILNNVVAFVGVLMPDGTLVEANQPALEAGGLIREDVIGRPFWDCPWWNYDRDVQAKLKDAISRSAAGEVVRYDATVRMAGDHMMTIDFQLAPDFDASGEVVQIIPSGLDITERKASEQHREFLLRELSHRVKNMLANIQAITAHTLRETSDLDAFRDSFSGRLNAIAACHDLLVETHHESADLRGLIESQVGTYAGRQGDRLVLEGDPVMVSRFVAHAFALVLHEMATNAAKHGALSVPAGQIVVRWWLDPSFSHTASRQWVVVDWVERGGPPVAPPTKKGFGSTLISRSLGHAVDGTAAIEYHHDGVRARFELPVGEEQ